MCDLIEAVIYLPVKGVLNVGEMTKCVWLSGKPCGVILLPLLKGMCFVAVSAGVEGGVRSER